VTHSAIKFSAVLSTYALALGGLFLSVSADAAENLAVGTCVSVRGQQSPGRIVALSRGGYVVQGQGKTPSEALNWATTSVEPGPCPAEAAAGASGQLAQTRSCPGVDDDGGGASALEKSFRAVIRQNYSRAAAPGFDGAVTVNFQSFVMSGGRPWREIDAINIAADQTKPVYLAKATLTYCTDYRSAIELRRQSANFTCFTSEATGAADCTMTGGGRDEPTQRISK